MDRAAHLETILDRQHDVQDDRIIVGRPHLKQGRLAIGREIDRVGLFAKTLGEHPRGVRLVLDQGHPHRPTLCHVCGVHVRFMMDALDCHGQVEEDAGWLT